ncbi:MAG: hypothetical protein NUV65_04025 [Candidatus Roizmanbacteria bacterium]|nr:hypothetical protein [Candidatus Roizmanbacteria bacterium]
MASIMDISESLAKEGRLAQDYVKFRNEAVNIDFKNDLKRLEKLTVEKMRILHKIIKEGPWLKHEGGIT